MRRLRASDEVVSQKTYLERDDVCLLGLGQSLQCFDRGDLFDESRTALDVFYISICLFGRHCLTLLIADKSRRRRFMRAPGRERSEHAWH